MVPDRRGHGARADDTAAAVVGQVGRHSLCEQQRRKHIDIVYPLELVACDRSVLRVVHKLVGRNTRVVDKDIDLELAAGIVGSEEGLGGVDDFGGGFSRGGEVRLNGGGLDLVGFGKVLAKLLGRRLRGGGGVGEEEVAALGREALCYGGADALETVRDRSYQVTWPREDIPREPPVTIPSLPS